MTEIAAMYDATNCTCLKCPCQISGKPGEVETPVNRKKKGIGDNYCKIIYSCDYCLQGPLLAIFKWGDSKSIWALRTD